jgi:hypothetical protein
MIEGLGREARWHMVGNDCDWIVYFTEADGSDAGQYRSNDFDDVLLAVAAWINEGKLPD